VARRSRSQGEILALRAPVPQHQVIGTDDRAGRGWRRSLLGDDAEVPPRLLADAPQKRDDQPLDVTRPLAQGGTRISAAGRRKYRSSRTWRGRAEGNEPG
jgi:hypothetical protein